MTTEVAAAVAFLALCLGSCVAPSELSTQSAAPPKTAVAEPVPNPRPAPAVTNGTPGHVDPDTAAGTSAASEPGSDSLNGDTGRGLDAGTSDTPVEPVQEDPPPPGTTQAGDATGDGSSGFTGSGRGAADSVPGTTGPDRATASGQDPAPAVGTGPAVYYVAVDDGGRQGMRFGCNDSLVAVRAAGTPAGEPLAIALAQLLSPGGQAPATSDLYNALSASSLNYVSGYLHGTTVVVNLSGQLQPGGICDNPRIEAQLTQTAVAATGASRAEIYVDGRNLDELLSLR
ncbi:GerMN domain-containing protein [Arthrobacter sp. ISL-30]|nr:GerMN domain-containing protein [Arthrobacter sp. ISL-30]